ncbi:YbaK/EbsC family protein [Acanthopleuribacter pedis]|uniref:YbaK/EbsC family protein n=1 Tax=Acanthopleuribacter pedis TaxID=442870 RepID=A0A8J7QD65_9BACT|nr:YbaK/EbsC family protein [Acanthopleuribacter pedis]MBO1316898.1 YbaK/EbsC family protein [Acanthopleuribacter pedis]
MQASAEKVQSALTTMGFSCEVRELPGSTRTAAEAAETIGCQVAQIVKSLIFQGKESGDAYYVAVSGENRVHEKRLGRLIGEKIRKADADFTREATGFAIGGIPPVGHAQELKAFVDEDLWQYDLLWAAAGTPFAVFSLTADELKQMCAGTVVKVT